MKIIRPPHLLAVGFQRFETPQRMNFFSARLCPGGWLGSCPHFLVPGFGEGPDAVSPPLAEVGGKGVAEEGVGLDLACFAQSPKMMQPRLLPLPLFLIHYNVSIEPVQIAQLSRHIFQERHRRINRTTTGPMRRLVNSQNENPIVHLERPARLQRLPVCSPICHKGVQGI